VRTIPIARGKTRMRAGAAVPACPALGAIRLTQASPPQLPKGFEPG